MYGLTDMFVSLSGRSICFSYWAWVLRVCALSQVPATAGLHYWLGSSVQCNVQLFVPAPAQLHVWGCSQVSSVV